jgi:hypothetical protein
VNIKWFWYKLVVEVPVPVPVEATTPELPRDLQNIAVVTSVARPVHGHASFCKQNPFLNKLSNSEYQIDIAFKS